ncbi:transmembrane transcriptional regulator (anti-sigma factor) [Pandoraea anapnoica]|uniref:Transmembrane transcriptional regulator (Anti-sigma factor) n=1 Tax=Pandoraea anapnoica TaxID=2508301 RepID=A0A5E4ZNP6_9BURK|nr:anti-sigma factor [Pandoraea anapnoica]VVE62062.1 transmembrane transcriptional regulator (anti-sigma factor) [Pandoraea anapnoica]
MSKHDDMHDDPKDLPTTSETTTLGKMLRDGSLHHNAPQALRERLRDELANAERRAVAQEAVSASSASDFQREVRQDDKKGAKPETRPAKPVKSTGVETAWGPSLAPWLFGGAGGAILGGLAVAMALLVARPPAPTQAPEPAAQSGLQPQEIVSSHVRALLSQHPIDVISTDQHTVKPWFNGRLDYAPPVVDLADKGFPLAGGRLDYVGGRTVSVLIYYTDKHPIDVYVYPARDKASAAPMITGSDGYAIARWRRNGMTYWAITDAEPSHLRVFVEALQAAT